jgi:protein-S-isoprenylcysteine O-methyltransferase Ste14
MAQNDTEQRDGRRGTLIGGAILLYFIAALEIVIMISPFAFFFYAVFNPILLGLNQSAWTRWLTAFFLPHMVVPSTGLLLGLRVAGSVLFLGGSLLFLVCAAQVYLGKLLRWGVATRGFYTLMRHPQYTGLALAGLGLTILWPRFLTLMLLSLMLFLYNLLARDEERRMLARYGDGYGAYMERTGMFWPRFGRRPIPPKPLTFRRAVLLLAVLVGCAAAFGFGLRAYTVARLPVQTVDGVDVLAVLPGDLSQAGGLLEGVQQDAAAAAQLRAMQTPGSRVLAYIVPVNYVMQGMIANTGDEWKLFRHHQTFAMIADYILHPVGHLQGGHMRHMMGMPMRPDPQMHNSPLMRRRIIFLQISGDRPLTSAQEDFGINNRRVPRFFADIHLHTREVLQTRQTPSGTGWGDVPTPMF